MGTELFQGAKRVSGPLSYGRTVLSLTRQGGENFELGLQKSWGKKRKTHFLLTVHHFGLLLVDLPVTFFPLADLSMTKKNELAD